SAAVLSRRSGARGAGRTCTTLSTTGLLTLVRARDGRAAGTSVTAAVLVGVLSQRFGAGPLPSVARGASRLLVRQPGRVFLVASAALLRIVHPLRGFAPDAGLTRRPLRRSVRVLPRGARAL